MCYKTSLEPGDFMATQSNVTRRGKQDVVIQVLTHSASIFDCKSCGNSRSVFRGLGRGLHEVSALGLGCYRSDQVGLNTEGSTLEDSSLLGKACLGKLGLERYGVRVHGNLCRENQVWTVWGRNRCGKIRVEIRLGKVGQSNLGLGMPGEIMPGESCLVNIVLNMPGKIMFAEIRVITLVARTNLDENRVAINCEFPTQSGNGE